MPLDVLLASSEDQFWPDMHKGQMKLKIRVRRMKDSRDMRGGFATFSSCFPGLCEGKPTAILPMSISQPCMPVANVGPTRILPHLYLGSQKDVLNKDLMTQNGISYVLNASNSCPKPDFICDSHFMRIPVNDNYCEKLLPWLDKSIEFIAYFNQAVRKTTSLPFVPFSFLVLKSPGSKTLKTGVNLESLREILKPIDPKRTMF
ncbi:Dual specificity protein phosphatase 8 [Varanus komodoensis]|nr:Dual specificity protein phosphatase 8 [Varanus komodoensis]